MTFVQRHAYGFGCGFAALFWPFFRKRRRIAVENLLKCRVAADEAEAHRLAKKSFCHFLGHIFEALCVPGVVNRGNLQEHFDLSEAHPEMARLLSGVTETPILLVSAHHGCWEAATNIISLNRPMIAIVRMLDNRFLRSWMKNHHFRGPVTVVSKNNGFKTAVMDQWLREKSAMTILVDQHAYGGAMLNFFGRPARTVTSAARLAIRTGYPVVVGSFVRVGLYRYRAIGGRPLVFSKTDDREKVAQILNDRLEELIRRYPEQYLWIHRRWRDD